MTRIGLIIAGLVGFMVVGRAAAYYAGVDALAFSLTALMLLALSVGLVELWRKLTWLAQVETSVRRLAAEPPTTMDALPNFLRPMLSAHLEREPSPANGPVFVPFLVGFLVLLGLLGTFLGLFETLHGARVALQSSGDIDSMRAGLTGPMAGLMRSFGTSAAGVAASAMLGLASVFVRREARRIDSAVLAACAGPLAPLSASRRQLVALEQLAKQGDVWIEAAGLLHNAVEALQKLSEKAEGADERVYEATSRIVAVTSAEMERVTAGLSRVEASWESLHTKAAEEHRVLMADLLEKSAGALTKSGTDIGVELAKSTQVALQHATKELAASFSEHVHEVRAAADAGTNERIEAERSHQETIRAGFSSLLAKLEEDRSVRREADSMTLSEMKASMVTLQTGASAVADMQHVASREQHILVERFANSAKDLSVVAERQAAAVEAFVDDARKRMIDGEVQVAQKLDELIGQVADAITAQSERLAALERSLAERHEQHVSELHQDLVTRAENLASGLHETAEIARSVALTTDTTTTELAASIQMFQSAVEQHAEAADAWLRNLGGVERAVEAAGEGAAVDMLGQYLARTHELFDQQLGFQQELLKQIRSPLMAPSETMEDLDVRA